MPYPGLEVVVQYWLYSLVDDWHSTPRSVSVPGAGTVRLPGINQHHEGDWEAVTVGMSADRPLFVDWSAHCAGEWRPFAGATLVADPAGSRTHPVSWVALGSHANLPAPVTRTPALVEVRPAHGDVRAPARRERDRPGRGGGARQPSRRRARNSRPRGQRHPAGVPA